VGTWLENSGAFLGFYEYPRELWGYLRSPKLMERLIRELKRGTKVRDHNFHSEAAVYMLLYLESERQETRWGERRLKGVGEARDMLQKMLAEQYGPLTQRLAQTS
jgi:transposase-like protein